ncbi:DUF397 domain-containing protein [Embleya sp. NPDC050154]|uniref:DUF397 domain-containing protein n=1 Tax=unclassified Embleya TaxID=2699296 RepID=UPI00379FD826
MEAPDREGRAECVEVAPGFSVVRDRDSKDLSVGHLVVVPASWFALLSTLLAA